MLCCRTCDAALALTLPAHGIAECSNAARGTCGNNAPDAAPTHRLPALCWQCVQCQRGVCACGDAACGAASFRGLRHEDLVRAGLGKNQCTGMPPGLSAGEFTERVLHACLDGLLLTAGQTQALAAFVCAYPDSVCLLAGAHTPQPPHSPTSQRARRTSTLCNVVDMEAALHHAAKTCGLAVKIDAIREVVAMMQPDDGGMISHRAFRKFVQAETAFLSSAYRWRLVGVHACRPVFACVCLHKSMHADIEGVCAAHEHAHRRAVACILRRAGGGARVRVRGLSALGAPAHAEGGLCGARDCALDAAHRVRGRGHPDAHVPLAAHALCAPAPAQAGDEGGSSGSVGG